MQEISTFMMKCSKMLKFGEKKPDHIIRYHVKNMYNTFFKDESTTTQAQLLRGPIRSKKLKEATSLLGIQKSTKDTKVKQNVFENITSALKYFGKSRKKRCHCCMWSDTNNNCFI